VDRSNDGAHHRAGARDLGQLEGDGAGVADDAGADLDQLEVEAGRRLSPVAPRDVGQSRTSRRY